MGFYLIRTFLHKSILGIIQYVRIQVFSDHTLSGVKPGFYDIILESVKVYLWYNTGEALVILNMLQRVQVTVSGKLYRKVNPFSNYDVILRCLELCTKFWTSRPQLITLALHKKWKFSIKDIFSKCDQIRIFLWSWSHLLKKSSIKKLHFYSV